MLAILAWVLAGVGVGMAFQWWREKPLRRAYFRNAMRGALLEEENAELQKTLSTYRKLLAQQIVPYVRVERGH
jgi:hypothetical protein